MRTKFSPPAGALQLNSRPPGLGVLMGFSLAQFYTFSTFFRNPVLIRDGRKERLISDAHQRLRARVIQPKKISTILNGTFDAGSKQKFPGLPTHRVETSSARKRMDMPQTSLSSTSEFSILTTDGATGAFAPLGPNIKALMVWPRFPPSFWGFEGVLEMIPERSMTPPLGLITVAALCPAYLESPSHRSQFRGVARRRSAVGRPGDGQRHARAAGGLPRGSRSRPRARTAHVHRRTLGQQRAGSSAGPWPTMCSREKRKRSSPALPATWNTARRASLYRVAEKPDVSHSPVPRFDLLRLDKYTSMPVQFSRGCPFQCEFCDIITIYGRRPRTKTSAQLITELEVLRELGWRNEVFIVDDNFIGNQPSALQLARDLTAWQKRYKNPFSFYTEASIDLADHAELLTAMVEANFMYVFIGIETPSAEALKGSKKFQNLRKDNIEQIYRIQQSGLWVLGGFIVGFDSDDETIFERQVEFIERTAITWAMAGVLQAPPTTALYDRMKREGRLYRG